MPTFYFNYLGKVWNFLWVLYSSGVEGRGGAPGVLS